jgi:hypothetical protein
MAPTERAEPRKPRRYSGKPFAIGFGVFLVVATVLTSYYAARNELARQHAMELDRAAHPGDPATP